MLSNKFIVAVVLSLTSFLAINLASPSVYAAAPNPAQQSTMTQLNAKAKSSWPWYVARASGLVAAVLLLLLIVSGIGLVAGFTYKILEPVSAWAVHRALAISLGVAIVIHGFVLLFDKFVSFNIFQLLIPYYYIHYNPVVILGVHLGPLYLAMGITAFYLSAIIILSSLMFMGTKPKPWRKLHYLSYLLVFLVFFHGMFAGTDLKKSSIGRDIWIFFGIVILLAVVSRLRRAKTITETK